MAPPRKTKTKKKSRQKPTSKASTTFQTEAVELIGVAKLKPFPGNPRYNLKPGDPGFETLKRVITAQGYRVPLVWNKRTGHVVGGNLRLSVLKAMGAKWIQVSVCDMDAVEEKALNYNLNRQYNEFDPDLLNPMLEEIKESGILEKLNLDLGPIADPKFLDELLNSENGEKPDFGHGKRATPDDTTDVAFSLKLSAAQSTTVWDAIKRAKAAGAGDTAAALTIIAGTYKGKRPND